MSFDLALHSAAAVLCASLAVAVVWRDRRTFVHRALAMGLLALGVEAACGALIAAAALPARALTVEQWRMRAAALLPGLWLLFSLAFARSDHRAFVRRWRALLAAAFVVPVGLALAPAPLTLGTPSLANGRWAFPLGAAGQAFHLALLAGSVLVLANLERTLRASTGSMRWFIKYMVLGAGGLFAARIFTSSQALLFRTMDSGLHVLESAALVVAAGLMGLSLLRARLRDANVYVSHSVLYGSVTGGLVGAYLLAVGVLARALALFGGAQSLPAVTFLVFVALVALAGLLLSDRLRQRLRGFVSRNFHRPQYDYRKEWLAFTRATSTLLDVKPLAAAVASRISETLRVPSVTVWLLGQQDEAAAVTLGGSTVYAEREAAEWARRHGVAVVRLLRERPGPVDLHDLSEGEAGLPRATDTRYALLLSAGGEDVGFVVLGSRPDGPALTLEDRDLLRTFADQAAVTILGLRLSERLLKAKEMEAFQSLSAFFVHDLKNLASKLSLTLQNLPAHYDDPEFRTDLLATIERSVAKINEMCRRLSPLSRTLEIRRAPGNLSEVVGATLSGLNGSLRAQVVPELEATPPVAMDPDQIQKVVLNLLLNANDAVGEGGRIAVATGQADQWVYVSVSDDGCGMSPDFMARSLFKPFRTTKGQGLGIGLFHSKSIVEAHRGRIEVESEQGKGTTFRVLLPGGAP